MEKSISITFPTAMKTEYIFFKTGQYIKHWVTSNPKKGFGIHSPFMFYLVSEIINDFTPFYCFADIENRRKSLLNNPEKINITDLGAGSQINKNRNRAIKNIARYSLKPAKQSQLIFRLVNYFNPNSILELGTAFGITTSYLASVNSKSQVVTVEGCPNLAHIAHETFKALNITNVELLLGNFTEKLPKALKKLEKLDFVFFDGHHEKEATINYFNQCIPLSHNDTVFVFDDIYYTPEMLAAWNEIKRHPKVKVSLDLFYMGIVFFKKELKKQHFKIRF